MISHRQLTHGVPVGLNPKNNIVIEGGIEAVVVDLKKLPWWSTHVVPSVMVAGSYRGGLYVDEWDTWQYTFNVSRLITIIGNGYLGMVEFFKNNTPARYYMGAVIDYTMVKNFERLFSAGKTMPKSLTDDFRLAVNGTTRCCFEGLDAPPLLHLSFRRLMESGKFLKENIPQHYKACSFITGDGFSAVAEGEESFSSVTFSASPLLLSMLVSKGVIPLNQRYVTGLVNARGIASKHLIDANGYDHCSQHADHPDEEGSNWQPYLLSTEFVQPRWNNRDLHGQGVVKLNKIIETALGNDLENTLTNGYMVYPYEGRSPIDSGKNDKSKKRAAKPPNPIYPVMSCLQGKEARLFGSPYAEHLNLPDVLTMYENVFGEAFTLVDADKVTESQNILVVASKLIGRLNYEFDGLKDELSIQKLYLHLQRRYKPILHVDVEAHYKWLPIPLQIDDVVEQTNVMLLGLGVGRLCILDGNGRLKAVMCARKLSKPECFTHDLLARSPLPYPKGNKSRFDKMGRPAPVLMVLKRENYETGISNKVAERIVSLSNFAQNGATAAKERSHVDTLVTILHSLQAKLSNGRWLCTPSFHLGKEKQHGTSGHEQQILNMRKHIGEILFGDSVNHQLKQEIGTAKALYPMFQTFFARVSQETKTSRNKFKQRTPSQIQNALFSRKEIRGKEPSFWAFIHLVTNTVYNLETNKLLKAIVTVDNEQLEDRGTAFGISSPLTWDPQHDDKKSLPQVSRASTF